MNQMTDQEVVDYAVNLLSKVDADGTVTPEGIEFLTDNVPSSEDQQRIIQAIKDIKANEAREEAEREAEDNQGGDSEVETPAEAEA